MKNLIRVSIVALMFAFGMTSALADHHQECKYVPGTNPCVQGDLGSSELR